MEVEKRLANVSTGSGPYEQCYYCESYLLYETHQQCRCPECDRSYTKPGGYDFEIKLAVTIQK